MSSREIVLWLDERWYDALERHIKGESLQDKLENYLDELCNHLLPDYEYEQISKEVYEERMAREAQREADRRFAVFRVTERGEQSCFLVEQPIDLLAAARSMRHYTRKEEPCADFRHYYATAREITPEEFERHSITRAKNPKRVTGAFEIDLDRGEFASLYAENGWKLYTVKDVCAAAYHAVRKTCAATEEQVRRFAEHLNGKEISPTLEPQSMSMGQTMC
ncbi:MAG: hypothetical protein J6M06_02555 [Synergistaceae bacterium]|nr:hypothetical protein [Synergistaceae bacterium]